MSRRYARTSVPFIGTFLCILCFISVPGTQAQATAKTPPVSSPAREADIVAHLNAAVDWYHAVKASDTWLLQSDDNLYKGSQDDLANQALTGAFGYAEAMVAVIGSNGTPAAKGAAGGSRAVHIATRAATNSDELSDLHDQEAQFNQRIAAAQPQDRPGLVAQQKVLDARIDLDSALGDTLGKAMALVSGAGDSTDVQSLAEQVSALQRTVPGLFDSQGAAQARKAPLAVRNMSDGLASRAAALISFVRYRHSLDVLIGHTGELEASRSRLLAPLATQLRDAVNAGEEAGKETSPTDDLAQLDQARGKIEGLASRVKTLSAALIPLQAEGVALERSRSNLSEWKASLTAQTDEILRVLFLRAFALAVALIVLLLISEVWRRATFKYIRDPRRRRQLLLLRRFAMTIVIVFVIVMGFISDFSSLATFAGFITAGIAVALQAIILSVAAYFFLIGRFGVKVGDRVTVSGVTGDVIDIGLVRVFLMELAGTGIDLHPTGRVIVLANSALFSGTPLYKQLPGTDYAWHEIYVNVPEDTDTSGAKAKMLKAVEKVYGGYRASIERQHGDLERLLDFKMDLPVPSAHVRLGDSGLEVVVRYPAVIRNMSQVDELVTEEVLGVIRGDEVLKKIATSIPHIRAAVKS
jgi:small-conductance mechanosensitive channel